MIRIIVLLIISITFAGFASARERSGRVTDDKGHPVEFATVVLLSNGKQIAAGVTDSTGRFSLSIDDGKYRMIIRHLAYKPLEKYVLISDTLSEIGFFRLASLDINLDEITVTASTLTRQADRFVMLVNNNSLTLNKDATEILQLGPGVWVDDNGILINGIRGTKVFVNERELRLTGKELIDYLRNFRSSDIARVEIIPQAGAEYSADSHGGIIKLILRRQTENGIDGNIKLGTEQGKHIAHYQPSLSLNAHVERWTLSSFISGDFMQKGKEEAVTIRDFHTNGNNIFHSISHPNHQPCSGLGRWGVIYEPDTRNRFGWEVEYSAKKTRTPSSVETLIKTDHLIINSESNYKQNEKDRNFSTTFNYVHSLDTFGSTIKFITDYTNKKVTGDNDYHSVFKWQGNMSDSLYRNNSLSHYKIYTADLAFNKQLSQKMKCLVGMKYTRNDMTDTVNYESHTLSAWRPLKNYNYSLDYTENIGAVYGTFSFDIDRFSIVTGLRGEYTQTNSRNHAVHKSYFDWFPNLNVTYSFDPMRLFMLIGQYSRNIQRPNFWHLNPNRIQYSDYSYYIGNPKLRPTYVHNIGLTAVYHYRYVLSVGARLHRDLVREVCKTEQHNPNITYIIPENHYMENHYYIMLNAPFYLTKWWKLNINVIGVKQDIRGMKTDHRMSHYLYFTTITTGITLPSNVHLELSYSGTSRLYSANSGINPRHLFHVSAKKQLLKDKLTISLGVNNLFNRKTSYFSNTLNFTTRSEVYEPQSSRYVKLSLQYSFNTGKKFKKRLLESSSDTEKKRLKKISETK